MKRRRLIVIMLLIVLLLPVGVTFSKYVIKNIKDYFMEANNFFFNSDKLVSGGITYEINNWGGVSNIPIQFELNNHKNNLLTSASDIEYTISLDYDETSISCSLSSNSGVIYKNEKTDNIELIITPLRAFNDNESVQVTIEASSSSPYVKTLSATFIVTVGRRGIDYSISDSVGSPYLVFSITNALDKYKVIEPFGNYQLNHTFTTEEYLALSNENKAKCASAVITLSFNPATIVLDTTNEVLKNATTSTTTYNGVNYISSLTFNMDVLTSMEIRFYKRNSSINYTYPGVNAASVINFYAS